MSVFSESMLLVAEGRSQSSHLVSGVLRDLGYEVINSDCADSALEALHSEVRIDLVITDLDFRDGPDGPELVRRIRRLPDREDTAAIVVLARPDEEMIERAMACQPYGVVFRSNEIESLTSMVRCAVQKSEQRRERARREHTVHSMFEARDIVLENVPALIAVCDPDFRIQYANRRYAEFYHLSADDIIGMPVNEVIGRDAFAVVKPHISRALSGETVTIVQERIGKNGERVHLNGVYRPNRTDDRPVESVYAVLVDVTELKKTEHALRASREHLRATLDAITDGVIVTDANGRVTEMNPTAEQLTGWSMADAEGKELGKVFATMNSITMRPTPDPVESVLAEGSISGSANHTTLVARNGAMRQIAESASPIRSDNGLPVGVVMVFRDVSDEYQAQERIRQNESRLSALFANMFEGVIQYEVVRDPSREIVDFRIIDCNSRFEQFSGLRRRDIVGKTATAAFGLPGPPFLAEGSGVVMAGIPRRISTYVERLDVHLDISLVPWGNEGFAAVISDTSQLHRIEAERARAVAEGKSMFRELQHRVKNTFALIRGLITLEGAASSDAQAARSFERLGNRMVALTGLYEMLDETSHVSRIRLDLYLRRIVDSLGRGYLSEANGVSLVHDLAPSWLETKRAGSVGIIVTELVINSLKHAFVGRPRGTVRVATSITADGVMLEISDDGVGFEEAVEGEQHRTDGLGLVRSLCRQLETNLERPVLENGTRYRILLPRERINEA